MSSQARRWNSWTDSYRRPFLIRQVTAGHEIKSEVGLCIDHSSRSPDWKCACLFLSWLHSLIWTAVLRLATSWLTTPFFFCPAKEICHRVLSLFAVFACNLKKKGKIKVVYSSIGMHRIMVFSSAFVIAQPFYWLQRRIASQPCFWPWLP